MEPFLAVTCHFCNDKWVHQSILLRIQHLKERHTGEHVAKWLKRILDVFQLRERVLCIVSDNASVMSNAAELLNLPWAGCWGHTLQLCVQKVFERPAVEPILQRIRKLVKVFRNSVVYSQALQTVQENAKVELRKLKNEKFCLSFCQSHFLLIKPR